VKDLLLLIDHKGRGLFRMKRTESSVILSGLFEGDIVGDHFPDAGPIPNFRDLVF
jgi:hypothetical protein